MTVCADGKYAGIRLVFTGVQNRPSRIADIPTTGFTKWTCSVAQKGFVTEDTMLEICMDLRDYIEENNVPRPVILWLDGHKSHYSSLAVAEFCKVRDRPSINIFRSVRISSTYIVRDLKCVQYVQYQQIMM